jgi:hypothetical protein
LRGAQCDQRRHRAGQAACSAGEREAEHAQHRETACVAPAPVPDDDWECGGERERVGADDGGDRFYGGVELGEDRRQREHDHRGVG